jgi:hypothetical protein
MLFLAKFLCRDSVFFKNKLGRNKSRQHVTTAIKNVHLVRYVISLCVYVTGNMDNSDILQNA